MERNWSTNTFTMLMCANKFSFFCILMVKNLLQKNLFLIVLDSCTSQNVSQAFLTFLQYWICAGCASIKCSQSNANALVSFSLWFIISSSSSGIVSLPSTNFQSPCLEKIVCILNFQRWKLPPSNFSMTFKDSIWKNDILLNTNAKTFLCLSIQMNWKWEKFKLKNLLTFEDFTSNFSHSMAICHKTKCLQENPQTFEKISCTSLKFHLKLATMAKNSLPHTWNLKLSTTWKPLFHTFQISMLKLSTTWRIFFHTLSQTSTLKLSATWRTLFHTLST